MVGAVECRPHCTYNISLKTMIIMIWKHRRFVGVT